MGLFGGQEGMILGKNSFLWILPVWPKTENGGTY